MAPPMSPQLTPRGQVRNDRSAAMPPLSPAKTAIGHALAFTGPRQEREHLHVSFIVHEFH